MRLTARQLDQFAQDGFLVVAGVVDDDLLAAADAEIDLLLDTDPPPRGSTGKHFWFREPHLVPAADAALHSSPALRLAEQLTWPFRLQLILDHVQIALNIPPNPARPGGPHIDGHARAHPGQSAPHSFTLLAGIFLSDEREVDRGNLWVWPGSHLVHERVFRERGPDLLMSNGGHVTLLANAPALGPPVPVLGRRGDLLLAHFLLGHNTGSNVGAATRRMLYYRLGCPGHRDRWKDTFVDAFTEYPRLRPVRRPGAAALDGAPPHAGLE